MNAERGYPVSPQHRTVLKQLAEKYPQAVVDKASNIIANIDKQLFDNLSVYKPEKFPGVILPYTTFSCSTNHKEYAQEPPKLIYETIINGFATPPNGHPLTQEIIYPRVFSRIMEAKKTGTPTNMVFICVGQVSGEGGKTTKQFNKAKKKEGFGPEAELIAELTNKLFPQDEAKERINMTFFGRSMGAIKALETAMRFHNAHPEIPTLVEQENPPRTPANQPTILQVMLGYAVEGLLKKRVQSLAHEIIDHDYSHELKNAFEQRGINTKDTLKERLHKEQVIYLNVLNIMKNKLHKKDDFPFPVKAKVGGFDPINLSFRGVINTLFEKTEKIGSVEIEYAKTTHSLYKYPVDLFAQTVME